MGSGSFENKGQRKWRPWQGKKEKEKVEVRWLVRTLEVESMRLRSDVISLMNCDSFE